jgi:hypothetical protein
MSSVKTTSSLSMGAALPHTSSCHVEEHCREGSLQQFEGDITMNAGIKPNRQESLTNCEIIIFNL